MYHNFHDINVLSLYTLQMSQMYLHNHVASTMYIVADSIHTINGKLILGVHNLPECTSLDRPNVP